MPYVSFFHQLSDARILRDVDNVTGVKTASYSGYCSRQTDRQTCAVFEVAVALKTSGLKLRSPKKSISRHAWEDTVKMNPNELESEVISN